MKLNNKPLIVGLASIVLLSSSMLNTTLAKKQGPHKKKIGKQLHSIRSIYRQTRSTLNIGLSLIPVANGDSMTGALASIYDVVNSTNTLESIKTTGTFQAQGSVRSVTSSYNSKVTHSKQNSISSIYKTFNTQRSKSEYEMFFYDLPNPETFRELKDGQVISLDPLEFILGKNYFDKTVLNLPSVSSIFNVKEVIKDLKSIDRYINIKAEDVKAYKEGNSLFVKARFNDQVLNQGLAKGRFVIKYDYDFSQESNIP